MKKVILVVLVFATQVLNITAQNLISEAEIIMQQGLDFYYGNNGCKVDHSKAYSCYLQAAQMGLDLGMLNVGAMLYNGDGVDQDYDSALKWYTLAAEKGLPEAYINLGWYYVDGKATKPDCSKSTYFFKKAFELGAIEAARILSYLYFNGVGGLERDLTKMFEWNLKLASMEDPNGLYNVGICYCRGYGVDVDEEIAIQYFKRAVDMGSLQAAHELVRILYHQQKDAKVAAKYVLYLALNDDAESLRLFGDFLAFGKLGYIDYDNAFIFYDNAALQGDDAARCSVAICYINGFGTAKNYSKAHEHLKKAVLSGNQTISNYAKSIMSQYKEELSGVNVAY